MPSLAELRSSVLLRRIGELPVDILVDGPFVESLAVHAPDSPVSSRNQQVRVLNPDFTGELTWASDQIEVHVFQNDDRLVTGYQGQITTHLVK